MRSASGRDREEGKTPGKDQTTESSARGTGTNTSETVDQSDDGEERGETNAWETVGDRGKGRTKLERFITCRNENSFIGTYVRSSICRYMVSNI
jgi:hypothetical protein